MIDKIVVISGTEALIVFTNQSPKRLSSPEIKVFVAWFLANNIAISHTEYCAAVNNQGDTAVVELKEVA